MNKIFVISCAALCFFCFVKSHSEYNNGLPEGFVYLKDFNSDIIENLRYASSDNFLGRKVINYQGSHVICTRQAAIALNQAQQTLKNYGYGLVIYDAYRPASSTRSFYEWCNDQKDINQTSKRIYYPYIQKNRIIPEGYVAIKSGHNRGSTVDLTIIRLGSKITPIVEQAVMLRDGTIIHIPNDNTLFMGSGFDLFHEVSHHGTTLIPEQATKNRQLLRKVMENCGFKILPEQWWHYTLINQPFPDTYFDFPIRNS